MEEVHLINSNFSDRNDLDELQNLKLEEKSFEKNKNLNRKSYKNGNKLFCKILFFQFIVSGFVFLNLFLFKKFLPNKFNGIAVQLKSALNEGPKFCDNMDMVFSNIKNFSLSDHLLKFKNKGNLNNVKNKIKESSNKSSNKISSNLNVNQDNKFCLENVEQQVDDDLENMSVDDGDVFFADFVPPIVNCGGRVSSKFGKRINPLTKKAGDFHKGVDVIVGAGTPIVAICDGVVQQAAFSNKSGNFMIINHSNGCESRVAHCNKLLKKAGDHVKKNEVIAYVGSTGNVTGTHMHFGLRNGGNWIDPKVVYPAYG